MNNASTCCPCPCLWNVKLAQLLRLLFLFVFLLQLLWVAFSAVTDFSSFFVTFWFSFSVIQQLNFYAFRKIKYADTIRIDPKLEAETANYWRFRHEKFQRGKPELLGEIKRMNGQKQQQKKETPESPTSAQLPTPIVPPVAETENSALKSEVSNLKQRIEAMTRNIDELTSMVQKVTLATCPPTELQINDNNKRTKLEDTVIPDDSLSAPMLVLDTPETSPGETSSSMDLDAFPLPPSIPSPMPLGDRTSTSSTELSDEGFVDQLFTAFKTEDYVEFYDSDTMPDVKPDNDKESNRPRPELMNRLSDALSALPRDIQELIVDRLIQAITSPKEIQEKIAAVTQKDEIKSTLQVAPTKDPKQIANLQLAAATLAALLSQCSGETKQQSHTKALLIPVHA